MYLFYQKTSVLSSFYPTKPLPCYNKSMYLTIDIGGTKTLIALFNSRRHIVKQDKFPTDHDQATFLNTFFTHLQDFTFVQPTNIVVAVAGVIKNNRPTWFGNLPWNKPPLTETIKKLFSCPVFFINDADSATFYESHFYPGKSIYLTFSTGIGGGIAYTTRSLEPHRRRTALLPESADFEPGHKIYPWQDHPCEWEDIASANAIRTVYNNRPVTTLRGKKTNLDIARRVALGLIDIVTDHQPDTIIIGGPLSLTLKHWRTPVKRILRASTPVQLPLPRIRQAKRPTASVSYGACLYGERQAKIARKNLKLSKKTIRQIKKAQKQSRLQPLKSRRGLRRG